MRRLIAALGLAGGATATSVALLLARRRGQRRALDRLLHAAELRGTLERLQDDLAARSVAADPGTPVTITVDRPAVHPPALGSSVPAGPPAGA